MRLYHATSAAAADVIDQLGFLDGAINLGDDERTGEPFIVSGVFFSDRPVDVNEGANACEVVFAVDVPASVDLGDFEILQEGWPYREWCVPAALANTWPIKRLP